MQLNEVDFGNRDPIEGYGPDFFRVAGVAHAAPLIVAPGAISGWAGFDDADSLAALAAQVDVLFIGTGADIAPLPALLRTKLEEAGVPFEIMSSPSACRTYNVLLSEGRRIAAALMPVGATQS